MDEGCFHQFKGHLGLALVLNLQIDAINKILFVLLKEDREVFEIVGVVSMHYAKKVVHGVGVVRTFKADAAEIANDLG